MDLEVLFAFLATGVALFYWFFLRTPSRNTYQRQGSNMSLSQSNSFKMDDESDQDDDDNDPDKPKLTVIFGSQTGTAESFSRKVAAEAKKKGFRASAIDVEEYGEEPEQLCSEEGCVLFFVATYGEGEPPDSMLTFYRWLMDDEHDLSDLKFGVFGLGNTQYEHYNKMGRELDAVFEKYGGKRVVEKGEGNDDGTLEEDFLKWKETMWPTLCSEFGLDSGAGGDTKIECAYDLIEIEGDEEGPPCSPPLAPSGPPSEKFPVKCLITKNEELHTDKSDRSCVHVEIDITGKNITYEHGDHLGIFCDNEQKLVAKVAKRLGHKLEKRLTFVHKEAKHKAGSRISKTKLHPYFPAGVTLRRALSHFTDLTCLVGRDMLQLLSEHAEDDGEAERLKLLASIKPEGIEAFNDYIRDHGRTVLCVLEDFPSAKPPLDIFMCTLPRLQCRYYSIASSPKVFPNSIHLCVAHTSFETLAKRIHNGPASTYLKLAKLKGDVPCFVRTSHFRLPSDPATPVVMVGPGTGLAPFRGFIQERQAQKDDSKLGDAFVFFGCRHPEHDYIYQSELEGAKTDGVISDLELAFSRETSSKVYVQHRLKERAAAVWKSLEKNGHFYVCGDAKAMANDVHKALLEIIESEGKISKKDAEAFVAKMEKDGRYLKDVW